MMLAMTHPQRLRRVITSILSIVLVIGLAACDVTLTRAHSRADITRTCEGDEDHVGTSPYRTQVSVVVKDTETENYDILISLNNGAVVAGLSNVAPGNGLLLTDNTVNTVKIDIAVVPSDSTGTTDSYEQIFNACPEPDRVRTDGDTEVRPLTPDEATALLT